MSGPYIAGEHYTNLGGALHWNFKGYTRLKQEGLWSGETSDEAPDVEAVLSGNVSTTRAASAAPPATRTSTHRPVTRALPGYVHSRKITLQALGKSEEPRRQGSASYERGRRIALKALGGEVS